MACLFLHHVDLNNRVASFVIDASNESYSRLAAEALESASQQSSEGGASIHYRTPENILHTLWPYCQSLRLIETGVPEMVSGHAQAPSKRTK